MAENRKEKLQSNFAVIMYMEEIAAQVVAKSGIPSDRYHMGKIILQCLQDDPDFVLQIDGALNISETIGSVYKRTVRCAVALKNLGLKYGDVVVLMAPNHIDLAIPFYASYCLGLLIAGVDMYLGVQELKDAFSVNTPKIVFCQNDKALDVDAALKLANINAHIVTFDKGTQFTYFADLLESVTETEIENFRPTDFDPEETVAILTATSGTTGLPKSAALTHKNLVIALPLFFIRNYTFPTPTRVYLYVSPMQWISAGCLYTMSAVLKFTRLQTSATPTPQHIHHLINTYKPTTILSSPTYMTSLVTPPDCNRCDFSSFEHIYLGGSMVTPGVVEKVKAVAPQAQISLAYGMSEVAGLTLVWDDDVPAGCVGRPIGYFKYRLVDCETSKDIEEPNVVGELWLKSPTVFKGYHNNPEGTKEAFSEDGWLKTGDLFTRDQYNHYTFVDRLKSLLKYRNHQISPAEVELIIRSHPGVIDVAVVGIPDEECGDLPAAGVVLRQGVSVTAQEIKDLVKEHLTDSKQLRGGVVFMDALPQTATTKVDRVKLKKMMPLMKRE